VQTLSAQLSRPKKIKFSLTFAKFGNGFYAQKTDKLETFPKFGKGFSAQKTKNLETFPGFGEGLDSIKTGIILNPITGKIMPREYIIVGAFEAGLSGEIEKEFNKLARMLTKDEFENKFNEFSSQKNWLVYQKRARNIMATYDEELRNIEHPKLIDYRKEFSQEDIQRLIG